MLAPEPATATRPAPQFTRSLVIVIEYGRCIPLFVSQLQASKFLAAAYRYLPSRDAKNTVWHDCRYTCRADYAGSVDVDNESCPHKPATRPAVHSQSRNRHLFWSSYTTLLFVSKIEAAILFCSNSSVHLRATPRRQ